MGGDVVTVPEAQDLFETAEQMQPHGNSATASH